MPKFTFICDHNDELGSGPVMTLETNQIQLHRVIEDFTLFLRGAGFVFDGELEIVDDAGFLTGDVNGGFNAD